MTTHPRAKHDKTKMLFLLFGLGTDRYALAADDVGEILPLVEIKALPGAPVAIAGLINYRGRPVPVIDLSALALGRPAQQRLSTRIVLSRYGTADGAARWLGLIVEQATGMMHRSATDFVAADVDNDATPYLGPVASDPHGLIQWVDPAKLLPPEIREMLFQQSEGKAA
jgi:chemotaxis-related protein WspB